MNHTATVAVNAGTTLVEDFGGARPGRAYPTVVAVYVSSAVAVTTEVWIGAIPLAAPGAAAVQLLPSASATSRVSGCAPVPVTAATSTAWGLYVVSSGSCTVRVFWTD